MDSNSVSTLAKVSHRMDNVCAPRLLIAYLIFNSMALGVILHLSKLEDGGQFDFQHSFREK